MDIAVPSRRSPQRDSPAWDPRLAFDPPLLRPHHEHRDEREGRRDREALEIFRLPGSILGDERDCCVKPREAC